MDVTQNGGPKGPLNKLRNGQRNRYVSESTGTLTKEEVHKAFMERKRQAMGLRCRHTSLSVSARFDNTYTVHAGNSILLPSPHGRLSFGSSIESTGRRDTIGEKTPLLGRSFSKDTIEQFEPEESNFKRLIVGYVICFASVIAISVSLPSVQALGGSIAEFELNAWRFGAQFVLLLPMALYRRQAVKVPVKQIPMLGLIIILYLSFNTTYFSSAVYIPVGTVDGLSVSVIIATNAFISLFRPKERQWHIYASAVLCVSAVLMITQPDFMFKNSGLYDASKIPTNWTAPCGNESDKPRSLITEYLEGGVQDEMFGYIFAVSSGCICAIGFNVVNHFVQTVDPFAVSFWVGTFGTILSLILMALLEEVRFPGTWVCWLFLMGHAIGSAQSTLAAPMCLQRLSPTVFTLINSFHLFMLFVFQYTILADIQPGHRNWLEIVGVVLLLLGCTFSPFYQLMLEARKRLSKTSDLPGA